MSFIEIWLTLILWAFGGIVWFRSMMFVIDMEDYTFMQKVLRMVLMAVLISLPIAIIANMAIKATEAGL